MHSRPIINTRDEPTPIREIRRLHVIVGDANMSETATTSRSARWRSCSEVGTTSSERDLSSTGPSPPSGRSRATSPAATRSAEGRPHDHGRGPCSREFLALAQRYYPTGEGAVGRRRPGALGDDARSASPRTRRCSAASSTGSSSGNHRELMAKHELEWNDRACR